jgi:hypothetical protein
VHERMRRRKTRFARERLQDWDARSLLVVGVTPTHDNRYVNVIERELRDLVDQCIATGIRHPDAPTSRWTYVTADARRLPFPDDAFDVVYSNAVIEHVGVESDQRRFTGEVDRVGRHWIMTTPNLCFPVEAHTWTTVLHWTRAWRRRHSGWITRLLTPSLFADLLPRGRIVGSRLGLTLTAVSD